MGGSTGGGKGGGGMPQMQGMPTTAAGMPQAPTGTPAPIRGAYQPQNAGAMGGMGMRRGAMGTAPAAPQGMDQARQAAMLQAVQALQAQRAAGVAPGIPQGIGKGSKGGGGVPMPQAPGIPPGMQPAPPQPGEYRQPVKITAPLRTQMYAQQQGLQEQARQAGIAALARENARPQVSWSPGATGGPMFSGINPGAVQAQGAYNAPAPRAVAQAAPASSSGGGGGGAAATKSISDLNRSAGAGISPPKDMARTDPVNYHILNTKALRARGGLRGRNG